MVCTPARVCWKSCRLEADTCAPLEALPQDVSTPELKRSEEGQPFTLVKALQEQGQFADAKRVITIDGGARRMREQHGGYPSNTTPVVVLRAEAENAEATRTHQADFAANWASLRRSQTAVLTRSCRYRTAQPGKHSPQRPKPRPARRTTQGDRAPEAPCAWI